MLTSDRSYKVVHQNLDRIVIEAEFDNFTEAAACLASSIFMDPFILVDNGSIDMARVTPEEARRHAVERIEFRPQK